LALVQWQIGPEVLTTEVETIAISMLL